MKSLLPIFLGLILAGLPAAARANTAIFNQFRTHGQVTYHEVFTKDGESGSRTGTATLSISPAPDHEMKLEFDTGGPNNDHKRYLFHFLLGEHRAHIGFTIVHGRYQVASGSEYAMALVIHNGHDIEVRRLNRGNFTYDINVRLTRNPETNACRMVIKIHESHRTFRIETDF